LPRQLPRSCTDRHAISRQAPISGACLSTRGIEAPSSPDWLHEIKYDGYRLRVERDGDRVRLITRGGYNWTKGYPWIVEAALKNATRFVIDGEAVILGRGRLF
jgi:bifunctional non-homologous end joining protein LigD